MMESTQQDSLLVTVVEAARIMGVSKSALYDLIKKRKFPFVVVGRRRMIERKAIPGWIVRHTQKSA